MAVAGDAGEVVVIQMGVEEVVGGGVALVSAIEPVVVDSAFGNDVIGPAWLVCEQWSYAGGCFVGILPMPKVLSWLRKILFETVHRVVSSRRSTSPSPLGSSKVPAVV